MQADAYFAAIDEKLTAKSCVSCGKEHNGAGWYCEACQAERRGMYHCEDCGAEFARPQGLGVHRAKVHGIAGQNSHANKAGSTKERKSGPAQAQQIEQPAVTSSQPPVCEATFSATLHEAPDLRNELVNTYARLALRLPPGDLPGVAAVLNRIVDLTR